MDLRSLTFSPCPIEKLFDSDLVSQVIAYEDESIELFFKDGSNLQLSPCGANFKYTRPQNGYVPSLGKRQFELTQRCLFATSETRHKVILGLTIRNQLCSRPYILSEFLFDMKLEPVRGFKEILELKWPDNHNSVRICDDGSAIVCSDDGYALLYLYPGGHKVEVHYNAAVSDNGQNNCTSTSLENSDNEQPHRHIFVTQRRIFPSVCCPAEWQWPLQLTRRAITDKDVSNNGLCKATQLPQSVPVKCPNQFRHTWRNVESQYIDSNIISFEGEVPEFADTSIKFLWCEGNFYWIHNDEKFPKMEVWLYDGDVFKSHPKNERYFIYLQAHMPDIQTGLKRKFNERIMSAAFLPHDTMLKSVMLRCIRMISYKSQHTTSVKSTNTCWGNPCINAKTDSCLPTEPKLPNIQASVKIPEVGLFSAVADSIEISFDDGAMLHMTVSGKGNDSNGWIFDSGQCRIVFSDGQYFVTDDLTCTTTKAQSYVGHVLSWVQWLSLPKLERIEHPFYSGTIYDQSQMKRVQLELEKIQNATSRDANHPDCDLQKEFQYLELTNDPKPPISMINLGSFNDVTQALSHTSQAIGDIDAIIASFRSGGA